MILNGVTVPTTSWTNTSITLTAPTNNCTGSVAVTTQYGTSNTVTLTITGTEQGCMYPPPVANAGSAQTVAIGATVQLDGTNSTDSTGTQLTYTWSFVSIPSGSAAALSNPTAPKPTFVADVYGNYTVQLVVNDGYHSSAPSQVIISTQDSAPVANAGPNQTVPTQTLVSTEWQRVHRRGWKPADVFVVFHEPANWQSGCAVQSNISHANLHNGQSWRLCRAVSR